MTTEMNNQDKVFSDSTVTLLNVYWVNQAGACCVAKLLYNEWISEIKDSTMSFEKWCDAKFDLAPYDEYE